MWSVKPILGLFLHGKFVCGTVAKRISVRTPLLRVDMKDI